MTRRVAALAGLFAALSPAEPVSRLIYSTYLNPALGSANQLNLDGNSYAAAADPAGDVILLAPTTSGAVVSSAVLVKVAPDGSTLFSITIPSALPLAVATDSDSNIYVCGASGVGFQTTPGVFLPFSYAPGFVAKLDPSGTLLWASQIFATPSAIAVDTSGAIYLTGSASNASANSVSFQTTPGAVQSTAKGQNAFVAKISTDGKSLLYATFLGGIGPDIGGAIAVGPSGKVYVAGETGSNDFPVTRNAYQPVFGGLVTVSQIGPSGPPYVQHYAGGDAFLSELDLSAGALVFSTFLGGAGVDFAVAVAVDASGNVLVTGTTNSLNFPVTDGAYQTTFGGTPPPAGYPIGNSFFAEFDSGGDPLYVSYHGVTGSELAAGAVLDSSGRLYFLEHETASQNVCTPSVSIIAVDTKTGTVAASEGVPGLSQGQYGLTGGTTAATLTIDASGIITVSGTGGGDQIQFLPQGVKRSALGWMLGRVDFSLQDELVPWCVANAASNELEPDSGLVSDPPGIPEGFVGAAQYVAPGEIISIFGIGVGPSSAVSIGTSQLTVLYAAANQVNAVVPYDLPAGGATLTIQRGPYLVSFPVIVLPVLPGIFTTNGLQAVATNEDGTINSPSNPAPAGSVISFMATGLGPLDSAGQPTTPFQVWVGQKTEVLSAVHPASLPAGVYQVAVRVPSIPAVNSVTSTGMGLYFTYGSPWFQSSSFNVVVDVGFTARQRHHPVSGR
jgi:uncharacterized protein (TIGR03437 family)